jgi:hypothetical protein
MKKYGWMLIALGALVLWGWYNHEDFLVQVNPKYVAMAPNTAIGFIEMGLALVLTSYLPMKYTMPIWWFACYVSALTLIEYGTGIKTDIHDMFNMAYIAIRANEPGMMSPGTAYCFMAASLSFMFVRSKPLYKFAYWSITLIASVVLLGYLSGVRALYSFSIYTDMAVHTAIGFILVAKGLEAHFKTREHEAIGFKWLWLSNLQNRYNMWCRNKLLIPSQQWYQALKAHSFFASLSRFSNMVARFLSRS